MCRNEIDIFLNCRENYFRISFIFYSSGTVSNTRDRLKAYNRVNCTKYETCAILHRFHSVHISSVGNSKVELALTKQ